MKNIRLNTVAACSNCHSTNYTIMRLADKRHAVICDDCHRHGKICQSQADAINKWNAKNKK